MKSNKVLKLLNITRTTLCSYVKKGIVKATMKPNGMYDYDSNSVYGLLGIENRETVIYGRVSTSAQKQDLQNQLDSLVSFANSNGFKINHIYSDIASGMNFDRKQFKTMIHDVINHKISNILISHKDRFTRISFDMWNELCNEFDCNIIVMNNEEDDDRGIFYDIISLLHCFSMRMYSKRRRKKLELLSNIIKDEE